MKKLGIIVLSIVMIAGVITGCGTKDLTPKEFINNSAQKAQEVTSQSFTGEFTLGFNFDKFEIKETAPTSPLEATETTGEGALTVDGLTNSAFINEQVVNTLKAMSDYKFSFSGKQTTDPIQLEMDFSVGTDFQGMNYTFDMPMIIKDDKMYMQLPQLLVMAMQGLVKEYISVDLNMDEVNTQAMKDNAKALNDKILATIDESVYKYEDVKEYETETLKPAKVVSVNITQDNMQPLLESVVNDMLPELIKYVKESNVEVDQEQLKQLEEQLATNKATILEQITEVNKYLTINNFKVVTLFDKDDYKMKSIYDIDISLKDESFGEIGLTLKGEDTATDINKELTFEKEIPSADKVMSVEELEQLMQPQPEVIDQTIDSEVAPQATPEETATN